MLPPLTNNRKGKKMNQILQIRRWAAPLRMAVVLLLAAFLAAMVPGAFAQGADFTLDERAVLDGMSR